MSATLLSEDYKGEGRDKIPQQQERCLSMQTLRIISVSPSYVLALRALNIPTPIGASMVTYNLISSVIAPFTMDFKTQYLNGHGRLE